MPEPIQWIQQKDMTVQEAMAQAHSWTTMNKISQKFSQHNLTTATWHQKSSAFNQLNPEFGKSPICPQSSYFGQKPKENDDPFMKRKVK